MENSLLFTFGEIWPRALDPILEQMLKIQFSSESAPNSCRAQEHVHVDAIKL